MANLPDRRPLAALLAGLVTVSLWGSAFVGIRAADRAFSPGAIALGRLIVSFAILSGFAIARRERLPRRAGDIFAIAAFGVLWLAIYSSTLSAAERSVDAGTAAMVINIGPILTAVLAGIFLHEGFPRNLFLGCAVGFAGVAIIALATTRSSTPTGLGLVLLAVAALAYATAVVVQKAVLARVSAFQVTWLGVAAGTLALLPFAPPLASEAQHSGPSGIAWIIYLGAFPTAVGFASWSFALRRTSAGRMASLTFLVPVFAILLSWLLLDETPSWPALAGGALCVAGVYLSRRP